MEQNREESRAEAYIEVPVVGRDGQFCPDVVRIFGEASAGQQLLSFLAGAGAGPIRGRQHP